MNQPILEVRTAFKFDGSLEKLLSTGRWTVLSVRHQFFGPTVYTLGRIR